VGNQADSNAMADLPLERVGMRPRIDAQPRQIAAYRVIKRRGFMAALQASEPLAELTKVAPKTRRYEAAELRSSLADIVA
jgi:hypothetical protein